MRRGEERCGTRHGRRDDAAEVVKGQLRGLANDVGDLAVTPTDVETALMRVKDASAPKPVPAHPTADPNAPGTNWQFADTSEKNRFDLNGPADRSKGLGASARLQRAGQKPVE